MRNPDLSEKAMICHIENLEKDVEKYWEIVYKDGNGEHSLKTSFVANMKPILFITMSTHLW